MRELLVVLPLLVAQALRAAPAQQAAARSPIVRAEFVFERAPFPSAHASTIVDTRDGLVAAWFGGTAERNPDVGIWVSRLGATGWSAPIEVADGVQPDGTRLPSWNPVLFQPAGGPLVLFYKVGPSPSQWWGLARLSDDGGRTWSPAIALPKGILGPIRAKPVEVAGVMLAGSSTEHDGWIAHMERFSGRWTAEALSALASWQSSPPLNTREAFGAIQPAILVHSASVLQILCRSRQRVITEAWSRDGGATWGPMTATTLPNPSAGIDALRLTDGRFLLVSNPSPSSRQKLELAISNDGITWRSALVLEEEGSGEHSYPALIQARDGAVHLTYTWRRDRIKHVVLDPAALK